jgi:tRNA A22 N-methylase
MEKIAPVGEKYRLKSKVPYKEGVVIINFTASDRVIISHVEDSLLNGPYFDYDSTYYKYGSYLNGEQYGIFVEKLLIEDEWYYNINHFEGYDQKYIQVEW